MNLAQLRSFVSVIEEGGFTQAANTLGLTQSGVSHAVASLERELGLALVSRARGRVQLTAHGELIIGHARDVVRRVDRIAEEAAAAVGRHQGRLRVAGFPSAGQLLPAVIAELGRRLPEVTVVLLEGSDIEVRGWLDDGVIDVGVVAELLGCHPSVEAAAGVLLCEDRMVAVLSPDHPLAGQADVTLTDLTDDPFLLSDSGCEPLLRQMHEAAGIELRPRRRVRDMSTLLALVREQLGVTVVPELSLTGVHGLIAVPVTPAARRALRLIPADPDDITATVRVLLDITHQRSQAPAQAETTVP